MLIRVDGFNFGFGGSDAWTKRERGACVRGLGSRVHGFGSRSGVGWGFVNPPNGLVFKENPNLVKCKVGVQGSGFRDCLHEERIVQVL